MTRIGIVTGLQSEAALIAPEADDDAAVICLGPGPRAAADGARALIADGAGALVSFGTAGGLDPALATGTIVIGEAVVIPDGTRLAAHPEWVARAEGALAPLGGIRRGAVYGSAAVIGLVRKKKRIFTATGALALDMESHAVARVAEAAGLPFLAVRVVLDPASRAIPSAAAAGMAPDGTTRG
ncbi:MAG: hypothetical protein FJX67_16775, partial [Alphaproteobacteria bacterium]|nr:hypothetical protein [Alphaproteobacteria bacterium]